eukprot:7269302-Lingulodinium_polyedra.AAC.1
MLRRGLRRVALAWLAPAGVSAWALLVRPASGPAETGQGCAWKLGLLSFVLLVAVGFSGRGAFRSGQPLELHVVPA